jgi:hypothetical protein
VEETEERIPPPAGPRQAVTPEFDWDLGAGITYTVSEFSFITH